MDKPKCYLCGTEHKDYFKKHQLFDGRWVSVCSTCKIYYDTIEEEAKRRGLISSNSRKGLQNEKGGDKMKVEKGSTGGNNLKVEFIQERKITSLKVTDEGEMVTYEAKKEGETSSTKLVVGVSYEGQKSVDPEKWSLNNKSRNSLIDIWGDDTKDWVGKTAEISLSGDGEYKHIVVDTLRTK